MSSHGFTTWQSIAFDIKGGKVSRRHRAIEEATPVGRARVPKVALVPYLLASSEVGNNGQ